jgi:hypothetical protein
MAISSVKFMQSARSFCQLAIWSIYNFFSDMNEAKLACKVKGSKRLGDKGNVRLGKGDENDLVIVMSSNKVQCLFLASLSSLDG